MQLQPPEQRWYPDETLRVHLLTHDLPFCRVIQLESRCVFSLFFANRNLFSTFIYVHCENITSIKFLINLI